MADKRERFERKATERRVSKAREERLSESLNALADAVNYMTGERDLDTIMDGLESIERHVSKAKRSAERLAGD